MQKIDILMKYYDRWDDWRYEFEISMYHTFISPVKRIYRYIKRLIKWIPFLWNNEDWDSFYLLEVIRLKLEELEKAQRENKRHVGSDKRARKIREVLEHLKRYNNIEKYTYSVDSNEYMNNFKFVPYDIEKREIFKINFKLKFPFFYIDKIEKDEILTYQRKILNKKLAKKHDLIHKHQKELEDWHYKEFFFKLQKNLLFWWT